MPRAQWNTIGQPAITPSQGESPLLQVTHSPLARLAIHARGGGGGEVLVERKKERERERERDEGNEHFPRPETLPVAFQSDPAPGDVLLAPRSLDHKSILQVRASERAIGISALIRNSRERRCLRPDLRTLAGSDQSSPPPPRSMNGEIRATIANPPSPPLLDLANRWRRKRHPIATPRDAEGK